MAKTFLVGEGAVRLIPNAVGFHTRARRELAKEPLNVPVNLKVNSRGFKQEANTRLQTISLTKKVDLRADTSGFGRDAQTKLDATRKLSKDVRLVARADQRSVATAYKLMQAQLNSMGPLKVSVRATMDATSMRSVRAGFEAMARERAVKMPVEAQRRGGIGGRGGTGGSGGGGRSGGLYRTARTAAITTGITVAPIVSQAVVGGLTALIGAASQAAGALGLLPAAATGAAAGLAAIGIGMVGIKDAFSALGEEATSTAGTVGQSASQQASAQRAIASADRNLATAHRSVSRALSDLNDERKNAVRRLRDMNDELKMAPLNEREAALAIKEAYKRLQDAQSQSGKDFDPLEVEAAQIDIEKSKLQYDQLKKQNSDLRADVSEANRAGVEGDKQVIAAKDGVTDSVNGLKDAQDALTAAMESAAEASKQQAAGVDKVAQAMDKLSPKAQQFVRQIHALGPAWTETRKFIQDALFDRMGDSVTDLANRQLPNLKVGLAGIATEINGGVRASMATLSTPAAVKDFASTLGNIRGMYAGLAKAAAPFTQSFIDLTTVGSTFLPRFGEWISRLATQFQQFTSGARADGSMQRFFETSIEMAKQLGRIISNVGHVLGDVFSAGAEVGGGFLNTIETASRELRTFTESAEGGEALKNFFIGVREAVQALAPIISIVASTILTALGPGLTDLVIGLGPGLVDMFEGLSSGLNAIQPVMKTVGEAIGILGTSLGAAFATLGPAIADTLLALAPAMQPIGDLIRVLATALAPILPVLGQLVTTFALFAGPVLGALATALSPIITIIGQQLIVILEALMPLIGPISALFMALSPIIGLLAEMFGQLIQGALVVLVPALIITINAIGQMLPVVQGLLQMLMPLAPVIGGIAAALGVLFAGFKVFQVISAIIKGVQTAWILLNAAFALSPIGMIVIALAALAAGLALFFTKTETGRKVWDAIWGGIKTTIETVGKAIGWVLDGVGKAIGWVVDHWKIFAGILAVITGPVGWVVGLIAVLQSKFDIFGKSIHVVGGIFSWLWEQAQGAWNGIGNLIGWVVDNLVKPAFDRIGRGLSKVSEFFGNTVDAVRLGWAALQDATAGPINWVIKHVINGGIGRAWKAVDKFLGGHLPDWTDVNEVQGGNVIAEAKKQAGVKMATGGPVPMVPGAQPGKDSVHILGMPGEHMWDVMDVQRAGGQQAMYAMRDKVMRGEPFTWTPGGLTAASDGRGMKRMAKGGEVAAGDKLTAGPGEGGLQDIAKLFARIIKRTWPKGVTSIGGYRPPDGYNEHSTGRALDVMLAQAGGSVGDQIKDFSLANNPRYPINWTIWKQKMWYPPNGRSEGMEDRGSPTDNHFDHDHIFYKEKSVNPNVVPNDLAFGGFTDEGVRRGITAWAEKAFNTALGPVKGVLASSAFNPPPEFKAVPRQIYDGLVEPSKEKLLDLVSKLTSIDGWKDMLGGAVDKIRSGAGSVLGGIKRMLFDTGGVVRPGTTVVQNDTGQDEYLLNPLDTILLRGLVGALRGIGINPKLPQDQTTSPDTTNVNIDSVGGKTIAPSGELPVPEQKEITPPSAADLAADGELPGTGAGGNTIPLKRNPDGTYTSTDPEWAKLIARESGGRADVIQGVQDVNSGGNEASGLFQIAKGTWSGYGGTKYAPTAGQATPEQQAEIAGKIFDAEGGSPWGSGAGQNFGRENEQLLRAGLRPNTPAAPTGTKTDPISVTPEGNWPTTANPPEGSTTGSAYGQNLQGAAIGPNGEYIPDQNTTVTPNGQANAKTTTISLVNPMDTDYGKAAKSFATHTPLGIGSAQMSKIDEKAPALTDLANGVIKAAPAYAQALAGNPTELMANIATATGAWATKTATDFATYIPENAGGMFESALSAVAGPLVGTINTGMSKSEVTSAMEDVQNRQIRRTKAGRQRRG